MSINSNDNYLSLYEIIKTENGITKLPSNYKDNGKYTFLDYKNIYNKEPLSDNKWKLLPKINIFEKDIFKHYKSRRNAIAVTWSSETSKDVFQTMYIETDKPFVLNGFSKIFYINEEHQIHPKWLSWYLNYDYLIQKQRESIPYTTRCNMTVNELKNIKIKVVPISVQQSIIDIIEPKEELFIKYNQLVDITNLENFKKTWSNLIDIIEPFEKIRDMYEQKKKVLFTLIKNYNIDTKHINLSEISIIKTGKRNADFMDEHGLYRFFTCSINKILYCNEYSFDTEALIIAGNGDVGSAQYYKGKFDAYQRSYVIQTSFIGNAYYSFLKNKEQLINSSRGSVIKFLTLDMLNNLKISNDEELNSFRKQILKNIFLYEKILEICNKIINLLINKYIY